MMRHMVQRSRTAFAARWAVVGMAWLPNGSIASPTEIPTEDSLANQSTPEAMARKCGFPILSPAPWRDDDAGERSATPVSFELRESFQIVVRGAIGPFAGLRFLIDTGSIPSMVDRQIARRLGVGVQDSRLVAFGEKTHILSSVLPCIRLGPLRADAIAAGVGDLSFLHGVDAIIGLDVLSRSSFSIDYEARQMSFGPMVSHAPTVRLEINSPFLTVQLAIAGQPVRLLVDTGSKRLVLFEQRVRGRLPRLPVTGELVMYHISGASKLRRVRLPPVSANGFAIERLEGFLSDAPVDGYPAEIDGVLGMRALARKGAEFDFERGRLGFR